MKPFIFPSHILQCSLPMSLHSRIGSFVFLLLFVFFFISLTNNKTSSEGNDFESRRYFVTTDVYQASRNARCLVRTCVLRAGLPCVRAYITASSRRRKRRRCCVYSQYICRASCPRARAILLHASMLISA